MTNMRRQYTLRESPCSGSGEELDFTARNDGEAIAICHEHRQVERIDCLLVEIIGDDIRVVKSWGPNWS